MAATAATEIPPDAPEQEFKAVIDVMRNRSRIRGQSLMEVVLAKNQFSAVCREDYWRRALNGKWLPRHVEKCYMLLNEEWDDKTTGATHYYSPISMIPQGRMPNWAHSMEEVEIDGVRPFYFRFWRQKQEFADV